MALLALGKYAKMRRAQGSNYTATIQIGEEEPVKITATDTRVFEGDYSGKRIRVSLEGDGTLYWFLVEEGVTAEPYLTYLFMEGWIRPVAPQIAVCLCTSLHIFAPGLPEGAQGSLYILHIFVHQVFAHLWTSLY